MIGTNILFRKKTKEEIDLSPIENGVIWFDTTENAIYVDDDNTRSRYAGGNLSISDLVSTILEVNESEANKPVGTNVIKEMLINESKKPEIRYGKTEPDNSIGKNGDIYIKIK